MRLPFTKFLLSTGMLVLSPVPGLTEEDPWLKLHQAYEDIPVSAALLSPKATEPTLIVIDAEFACGPGEHLGGLFVSIADTAVAAPQAQSPQRVLLRIDGLQLDGARKAAQCADAGPRLLPQQATAFGTLSCVSDNGRKRSITVSRPLDLWYDCPGAESHDRPDADDLSDD